MDVIHEVLTTFRDFITHKIAFKNFFSVVDVCSLKVYYIHLVYVHVSSTDLIRFNIIIFISTRNNTKFSPFVTCVLKISLFAHFDNFKFPFDSRQKLVTFIGSFAVQ
jgi:hypothetical protein